MCTAGYQIPAPRFRVTSRTWFDEGFGLNFVIAMDNPHLRSMLLLKGDDAKAAETPNMALALTVGRRFSMIDSVSSGLMTARTMARIVSFDRRCRRWRAVRRLYGEKWPYPDNFGMANNKA
jgi:hypothetical protein